MFNFLRGVLKNVSGFCRGICSKFRPTPNHHEKGKGFAQILPRFLSCSSLPSNELLGVGVLTMDIDNLCRQI